MLGVNGTLSQIQSARELKTVKTIPDDHLIRRKVRPHQILNQRLVKVTSEQNPRQNLQQILHCLMIPVLGNRVNGGHQLLILRGPVPTQKTIKESHRSTNMGQRKILEGNTLKKQKKNRKGKRKKNTRLQNENRHFTGSLH